MLISENTFLRAIEVEDLETLRLWRNNIELRRFFREFSEISKINQHNWYEKVVVPKTNTLMFSILDRKSKRLLGACGLCAIDFLRRSADLSIYIGYKGIYLDDIWAIESANMLIKYGFEEIGLHRLWAEVYAHDQKKQIFFEKIGFLLEGRLRDNHWSEGKWIDSLYYGLLVSDSCRNINVNAV